MSEELKAAQARIACLEGEIAKRDETIARLEPQLNRAIQANYDLREELAACRAAVENCEVFRARIAELTAELAESRKCAEIMQQGAFAYQAELAAIRAQEPAARQFQAQDGSWHPFLSEQHYQNTLADGWPIRALYAAPVPEAKAQEPDCDRSACGDFSPGPCDNPDCSARRDRMVGAPAAKAQGVVMPQSPHWPADDSHLSDYDRGHLQGRCDMRSEVIRLNAAHVQHVSDDELLEAACHQGNGNKARRRAEAIAAQAHLGSSTQNADGYVRAPVEPTEEMVFAGCAALVGSIGGYEAGLVERCYDAMLAAAPAATAADAGDVLEQAMYTLISIGYHENSGLVHELRQALAAHRAKGVV